MLLHHYLDYSRKFLIAYLLVLDFIFLDDCQQYLSDVYGFVNHDDDHLVIATLNLFMNVEKAGMMAGAKGPQSSEEKFIYTL